MEQKIVKNNDFGPDEFDADELEVAEFLLEMGSIIFTRSSWAVKRKRSALVNKQLSLTPCNGESEKPVVNSSVNLSCNGKKTHIVEKVVERPSPETPLLFSPSDTDYRSKPSNRKIIKNKSNEKLKETVMKLSKQGEDLRESIKRVREHYENLKIENKKLKAAQLELSFRLERGNLKFYSNRTTSPDNLMAPKPIPNITPEEEDQEPIKVYQPQPSINNETSLSAKIVENSKHPYGLMPPSLFSGGACVKELSPFGIPDLNIKAEETFEMTAIASAQARKRRLELNKEKREKKKEKIFMASLSTRS